MLMLVVSGLVTVSQRTLSHDSDSYSHDPDPDVLRTNWMSTLSDCLRLSEISIPGTQQSMTRYGGPAVEAQTWSLREQLDAGIRYIDIRARADNGVLRLFHTDYDQFATFVDVMDDVNAFLDANPSETVLMRLHKEEGYVLYDPTGGPWDDFIQTFLGHMDTHGRRMWTRGPEYPDTQFVNPTLAEIRGRVVLLRDAPFDVPSARFNSYGIRYTELYAPDYEGEYLYNYHLYDKWEDVRGLLQNAHGNRGANLIFLTDLAQGYPLFPYFTASGHSDPRTDAPRLLTGNLSSSFLGTQSLWPDFPRTGCSDVLGYYTCIIEFEGINELTMDLINDRDITFAGIVSANFPGTGLISAIIGLNAQGLPTVVPPLPNLQVGAGTPITLSAAGSFSPQGAALTYRWEFDHNTDNVVYTPSGPMPLAAWDTDASGSPTVTHTYAQPGLYTVAVGVFEGCSIVIRLFTVTVTPNPLAATLTIAGGAAEALTGQPVTVRGTWSSTGQFANYNVAIDWPNNMRPRTVRWVQFWQLREIVEVVTFDTPGDYSITLSVHDDGAEFGTTTAMVRVVSPPPLNTEPTLTLPADITRTSSNPAGLPVTFTAAGGDAEDGALAAACAPAAGSTFPIGQTTVSCSVTDAGGLTASGTFTVTVTLVSGNSPPRLRGLINYRARAQSDSGAAMTFGMVSGIDSEDGVLPAVCTHQSGQVFPVGVTTVTCVTTDTSGTTVTGSFTIKVDANHPPQLLGIQNVVKSAGGASSQTASFNVTGLDFEDGSIPVSCTHQSGASFAVGTTVVTCSATDSFGARVSQQFVVKITS
jgi:1-phosphatidylinositol phosphodiesterase